MNDEEWQYYQANLAFNASLDSFAHYGVAGMHWGIRNADTLRKYNGGGLNSRGSASRLKRQQNLIARFRNRMSMRKNARINQANKQVKIQNSANQKEASPTLEKMAEIKESGGYKIKEKNPSKLTDAELNSANQRLQAEIMYKQRQSQLRELNLTKGQRRRQNIKKNALEVGRNVLKGYATKQLTQALNKATGVSNVKKTADKVKDTTDKATKSAQEAVNKATENAKENINFSVSYDVLDTPVSTFVYTPPTNNTKKSK